MSDLYNRIDELCASERVTITEISRKTGVSRGSLTDLKMGRTSSLSSGAVAKIANYFDVTVDFLLAGESPTNEKKHPSPKTRVI